MGLDEHPAGNAPGNINQRLNRLKYQEFTAHLGAIKHHLEQKVQVLRPQAAAAATDEQQNPGLAAASRKRKEAEPGGRPKWQRLQPQTVKEIERLEGLLRHLNAVSVNQSLSARLMQQLYPEVRDVFVACNKLCVYQWRVNECVKTADECLLRRMSPDMASTFVNERNLDRREDCDE